MDQPQPFDIDPIAIKYMRQERLTPEEEAILRDWISRGEGRAALLERLRSDPDWISSNLTSGDKHEDEHGDEQSASRIWDKLQNRLHAEGVWTCSPDTEYAPDPPNPDIASTPIPDIAPVPQRRHVWRYTAAACILLAAAGGWFWSTRHKPAPTPAATVASTDVQPGGNRATLTLSDGNHIDLDSTADGVLTSQGNTFVAKQAGLLAYNKASSEKPADVVYNILSTPRAGQFELTLSDGTRVWLNNVSSLRYPVWFTGDTREVDLDGEAYFEVVRDPAHPFRVHIRNSVAGQDGGTIDVLGTSFNIMAYNDENAECATLVEGRIRYSHLGNSAMLLPAEQSVLDASGRLETLHHVNVAEITAWKDGYFTFDHATLQTTMRQLARWYDISVDYQGDIPPQEFVGKIQRSMPLSVVLKGLEGDHIHFSLEGKHLTVTP